MIPSTSTGSVPVDANTQRILEQLSTVITDVEQRLAAVKMTLSQSFPNAARPGAPGLGHIPYGVNPLALQTLGIPQSGGLFAPGVAPNLSVPLDYQTLQAIQRLQAFAQISGVPLVSPFASSLVQPLGIGSPFAGHAGTFRY